MHMHSTCSDGTDSPEMLARLGKRRGLAVMSLTDHDTITGVPAFMAMCRRLGIRAVSGVEISADYHRTLHILGYNFDPHDKPFQEALDKIQYLRRKRNYDLLDKLDECGIHLTKEEVEREAGKGVVGRPHFAFAMIRRGIVHDIPTAFNEYLGREGKAYVHKSSLSPEETIRAIRNAGGLSVLAHPVQTCPDLDELPEVLEQLKSYGLWGLEGYSSHRNPEQFAIYRRLAREFDLEMTAGSDYHGRGRPGRRMGIAVPTTLLPWARLGLRM